MAQLAYTLAGSSPVIKKFQYGVTLTQAGIPFTISTTTVAGVVIGTTTGATDLVGISLDKGLDKLGGEQSTYTTTQGTGASSAERMVSLVINPDAAWRWLMSAGATANTALTTWTVTTASSGGTAVTVSSGNPTSPEMLYGTIWGLTGANAGAARKITATSSTAFTVVIPFDYGTVVGDTFAVAPYTPMMHATVQLGTNLTQADASIAVGTGAPYRVIELVLRDGTDSGLTNSYVIGASNSHALNLA